MGSPVLTGTILGPPCLVSGLFWPQLYVQCPRRGSAQGPAQVRHSVNALRGMECTEPAHWHSGCRKSRVSLSPGSLSFSPGPERLVPPAPCWDFHSFCRSRLSLLWETFPLLSAPPIRNDRIFPLAFASVTASVPHALSGGSLRRGPMLPQALCLHTADLQ